MEREQSIEVVFRAVSQYYNIDAETITSKNRKAKVTYVRRVAIYILHDFYSVSLSQLAKKFNCTTRAICQHASIIRSHIELYTYVLEDINRVIDIANLF